MSKGPVNLYKCRIRSSSIKGGASTEVDSFIHGSQTWPHGGEESMGMLQMTRGSPISHDSQQ